MPLQLRRGLDADRIETTFANGEPVWTTDTNKLYVGDGVTPGGVLVAGAGESTTTFVTIHVDEEIQLGTGTNRLLIGQSTSGFDNQFYITGEAFDTDDILFFDGLQRVQFNTPTYVNNTLTVANSIIGLNDGQRSVPGIVSDADSMLISVPTSGHLFFGVKTPGGVEKTLAITRNGNLYLEQGNLSNGGSGGITLASTDAGESRLYTEFDDGVYFTNPVIFVNTASGAILSTYRYNYATETDEYHQAVFDFDGKLTVPEIATSTATIAHILATGNIDGSEGFTANMTGFRAGWYGGTGGYSFKNDGAQDTGMFSWGDGDLKLLANGDYVAELTSTQAQFNKNIYLNGVNIIGGNYLGNTIALPTGFGPIITAGYEGGVTLRASTDNTTFKELNFNADATLNGADRINASTIYANATTQDLSLTANFNGYGSGAGGSVNIYSANGAQSAPNVEVLGDLVKIKSSDGTIDVATFDPYGITSTINSTLTIANSVIGLNNGQRTMSGLVADSDAMLINVPTSGHLIFGVKTPAGVDKSVAISRGGNVILENGQIGLGFPSGVAFAATDAGPAVVHSDYDDGVDFYTDSTVATDPTQGSILSTYRYTYATDSDEYHELKLDFDGVTTFPGEIVLANANEHGGAGYAGMITMTNSTAGATNINKFIRLNDTGALQIINSAYSSQIFEVTDAGVASAPSLEATSMMRMPVKTASALTAITGQVGWMCAVSDSAGGGNPNGMMAFWDTTNSRWSYVHDNSAV